MGENQVARNQRFSNQRAESRNRYYYTVICSIVSFLWMKGKQFLALSVNGKMRLNEETKRQERNLEACCLIVGVARGGSENQWSPSSLVSPVVWLRRVQCCKTANNPLTK